MKKIICLLLFALSILSSNICFAGSFVNDGYGIKFDVGIGSYLEDGWAWCDPTGTGVAYCYYFTPLGYMLANGITPDGQFVDAAGRWVVNGVAPTKALQPFDYELISASYVADPTPTGANNFGSLSSRITSVYNAVSTQFNLGDTFYQEAIEFTEGGIPSITFNSGMNTNLTFDLTGDSISDPADFAMDIYINGTFSQRISQRFVDLTSKTIFFPQNSNVQITIPVINDYYNTYVRKVYILSPMFG